MKKIFLASLILFLMASASSATVGRYQFFVFRENNFVACDTETGQVYGASIAIALQATNEAEQQKYRRWVPMFPAIEKK